MTAEFGSFWPTVAEEELRSLSGRSLGDRPNRTYLWRCRRSGDCFPIYIWCSPSMKSSDNNQEIRIRIQKSFQLSRIFRNCCSQAIKDNNLVNGEIS